MWCSYTDCLQVYCCMQSLKRLKRTWSRLSVEAHFPSMQLSLTRQGREGDITQLRGTSPEALISSIPCTSFTRLRRTICRVYVLLSTRLHVTAHLVAAPYSFCSGKRYRYSSLAFTFRQRKCSVVCLRLTSLMYGNTVTSICAHKLA